MPHSGGCLNTVLFGIIFELGVITFKRSHKMFLKSYNRTLSTGLSFENRIRVKTKVKCFEVDFRKISYSGGCFVCYGPKYSRKAMETYLTTTMTAEMVARNTTRALLAWT